MERSVFNNLELSFLNLWNDVINFLPELVVALVVVIIGWIIGGIAKGVIESIFKTLRVNEALSAAGADALAERAGYQLKAGVFVGTLVKWFVIIVFFVTALEILNLNEVTVFFRDVVLNYLPRVIVAVLILLVAGVVSNVASASVKAAATAAGFGAAGMLAGITRYAIIVFAVLAALVQLQIAPVLVQTLFMGIVFGGSLAFGLAFGLGGQEAARRYIGEITGHKGGFSDRT
jgi:hypothetical protein